MSILIITALMHQFATNYSKNGLVQLREIFTPGTLKVPKSHTALKELESIHKVGMFYFVIYTLSIPVKQFSGGG